MKLVNRAFMVLMIALLAACAFFALRSFGVLGHNPPDHSKPSTCDVNASNCFGGNP